ncbi:MAG: class I SAM-dependent methyltransferase [Planctomycetota bacterium]
MPMTQEDIRQHYEREWKSQCDRAVDEQGLRYSSAVEDAVLYPIYRQLITDLGARLDGGRVLDVGCGSGRWIRWFLEWCRPRLLMGIDYTAASVELLQKWSGHPSETSLDFRVADITDPELNLGGQFDWINVANVLFHIPEEELFMRALRNLAGLVASDGRIVTTEYLPRTTMRTEWMLVRSRYQFEAAVRSVGLRIVEIRATTFFANDPMGLDGPDDAVRGNFNRVRNAHQQLLGGCNDEQTRTFLVNYLADLERAALAFCKERLADVDLPSQKLVVLARAGGKADGGQSDAVRSTPTAPPPV